MGAVAVEVGIGHINKGLNGQAKEMRCFSRALGAMGRFTAGNWHD